HQRAARAFAVLSIIASLLSLCLYAALCIAQHRRPAWMSTNLAARLPLLTLAEIVVTSLLQLLLWSLMAGLYNRWRHAVEAAAGPAVQTFGLLGFSFALALMANIGQLAALPAVWAVIRLGG
uniref:YIP1 family protein n=1 Tax=Macrostomum lignano TaxID=282301 RepID=A0A1I8HBZ1_9PLAT